MVSSQRPGLGPAESRKANGGGGELALTLWTHHHHQISIPVRHNAWLPCLAGPKSACLRYPSTLTHAAGQLVVRSPSARFQTVAGLRYGTVYHLWSTGTEYGVVLAHQTLILPTPYGVRGADSRLSKSEHGHCTFWSIMLGGHWQSTNNSSNYLLYH